MKLLISNPLKVVGALGAIIPARTRMDQAIGIPISPAMFAAAEPVLHKTPDRSASFCPRAAALSRPPVS